MTVARASEEVEVEDPLSGFDLDDLMPDLLDETDLAAVQTHAGAVFAATGGVPRSFGNDAEALEAMRTGVALVDRSDWGVIRVADDHRIDFLHNQTTADFKALTPGQGTDTVFSTPSGRTVDLATAYVQSSSVMLVVSPTMTQALVEKLNKFIFRADKVTVQNVSDRVVMLSLVGPNSRQLLAQLSVGDVLDAPYASHSLLNFKDSPVVVAAGGGLPVPGYTLIADRAVAGELWSALASKGAQLAGADVWEQARVLSGRPAAGAELTGEFNVLEAGLYAAASLNKGCYLGQETLAKVHTNDAVKQQLWGVELESAVAAGTALTADGVRVGVVTSYAATPTIGSGHFALAYVRCRVAGQPARVEGIRVDAGGVGGVVTQVPFPSRKFAPGAAPVPQKKKEAVAELDEGAVAAEAERKAKKLAQMEARVAAYMAQQQAQKDAL